MSALVVPCLGVDHTYGTLRGLSHPASRVLAVAHKAVS